MNIVVASIIVWIVITYIIGYLVTVIDPHQALDEVPNIVIGLVIEAIFFVLFGASYAVYTAFQTLITAFVFGG